MRLERLVQETEQKGGGVPAGSSGRRSTAVLAAESPRQCQQIR